MSTDQSADHVAERAANWNRCAKNRHDATPRFDWKKIGQDRRRRRPSSRLRQFQRIRESQRESRMSRQDPDPPLARLHKITAQPMMIQRENRSASKPRIGALTM